MRIRRSVTRFFLALIFPVLCMAVTGYFGAYAIWGDRGILAFQNVQAELGVRRQQLAETRDARERLERRVELMAPASPDSDLVEELARGQLMDGGPGQVAVPRDAH